MIWLTEAMGDDTPSGGTCAGFTVLWDENKSDQGLHWSPISIGVARKALKALCGQEQVMPKWSWEEGRCCHHMDGG